MVDSVEVLLNLLGVKPSGLGPFSALPPLWCFNNNNNNNIQENMNCSFVC